jgi:hypothetical protein
MSVNSRHLVIGMATIDRHGSLFLILDEHDLDR